MSNRKTKPKPMKTSFGTKRFVDQETGELVEVQQIAQTGDVDFKKIWLGHILDAVNEVGNQKMRVLMHLLDKIDYQNRYVGTYEMIAKAIGCHKKTVGELMAVLLKKDVISRPQRGVIRVNPNVIFKGSKGGRMNILMRYQQENQMQLFSDNEAESNDSQKTKSNGSK